MNFPLSSFSEKSSLVFLFILSCGLSLFGQGWQLNYQMDGSSNEVIHIPAYSEGVTRPVGLFFQGIDTYHFSRFDGIRPRGYSSFSTRTYDSESNFFPKSSVMLGADTTIVLADKFDPITGNYDLFLSRAYTDEDEDEDEISSIRGMEWILPLYENPGIQILGASLAHTLDGHLISLGSIQAENTEDGIIHDLILIKTDLNGQIIWSETLLSSGNDLGIQIIPSPDGGYWLLKNVQTELNLSSFDTWLVKTNATGNWEWEVNLSTNNMAFDMVATNDGGLAITGVNGQQGVFVLKVDEVGFQIWRQDYPYADKSMTGRGIIEDLQNNLIVAGISTYNPDKEDGFLVKLTEAGTPLWERFYDWKQSGKNNAFNDIVLTPQGDYLMGGYLEYSIGDGNRFAYFLKTDTFGIYSGGSIQGNVFHDLDLDCTYTTDELNLENWNIHIYNDTLNYYGNTDEQGNYTIPVEVVAGDPERDYVVSVTPPSDYWLPCANDIPVSIYYLDTAFVDFPMQGVIGCPLMNVQVSNNILRPCESSVFYFDYCNAGTVIAEDASIEITLDEYLHFEDATIEPDQIDGQTYTFTLGDIGINECNELIIYASIDCDSVEIGDVLCLDTHIYPDSLCQTPGEDWSGALLELSYTCDDDDDIQFQIKNIGINEMANQLEYGIIEDAVLFLQGNFDLDPAQETEVELPQDNDEVIYHFFAQQEPNAPGPEWISLSTVGCSNESSQAHNQFPQIQGGPFTTTHCPIVLGSFDPNDKQAIPFGFDDEHYILPNIDINYTIRFQNTGTDTAFRVVIIDTLDKHLDPASIIPGPSSHPYDFRLMDDGVLSFTFRNIELPDSNVNLAASQGFVSFKIAQQPLLPTGTIIENNANIYFDFNDPILTNTTFHTVNKLINFVTGSVIVAEPLLEVLIAPNPMQNGAWIYLKNETNYTQITLNLYDVNGRQVKQATGENNAVWLERSNLPSGIYFFTVSEDKGWLARGKIIVE